ncbi:MAG: hypothetical protein ACI840_001948 [Ulvibacter sp.]|jgi:hypothetical protein
MKSILKYLLIQLILLTSGSIYAQVGVGTEAPDASSVLDVSSSNKGLLMPRLTTAQRDLIVSPATGLMIYNTTLNDSQLNTGTSLSPNWAGVKGSMIDSVTEGDIISTTSTDALLASGMTMSIQEGSFLVLFNAQHKAVATNQPFSSAQGVIDMDRIYQELTAITATNTTHTLVFGNGENLLPGVYDLAGATSIAGTLTLDGGGDSNSVFIIRSVGAFTAGDGTTVNLINGASSNNIFWMSEAALSTGDNSVMKGTLVSAAGAIVLGDNANLEGRLFTKSGALSLGANTILTAPTGLSPIDLGLLSSFVMFTSNGAVSDVVTSAITGDVGTALGALTILGTHVGGQYPAGTEANSSITATTYSIYQNGVELTNSISTINSESSVVCLETMVTALTAGEVIEVRWKVDTGQARLENRILSVIRSEY